MNDSFVTSHSRWSGVCLVNRARASRDGSASQRVYWQCPVPSVVVNVADVSKMKRTFTFRVALQLPHVRRGIRLDLFGHWNAVAGGLLSKNRRNNISACIRFFHPSLHSGAQPSPHAAIVIDVGKTFRDSILSWFGRLNVTQIDSVLISHKHADAIGGLDDLRDMQRMEVSVDAASGLSVFSHGRPLNLVADADCLWGANGISTRFAYLNPPAANAAPRPCHVPFNPHCPTCVKSPHIDASFSPMVKPVASLTWWCAQYFHPFSLHGVSVMAIPLLHGRSDGQLCSGFVFNGGSLVWLSDVVELPEESTRVLQRMAIHTLVIDCDGRKRNNSHFTLEESVAAAKSLRAQKVYCVGMSCSLGSHDAVCEELAREEELDMTLAHDGLTIGPWPAANGTAEAAETIVCSHSIDE